MNTLSISRKIYGGQSLARILMNRGFRAYALRGRVVDVGGGRDPNYFDYFNTTAMTSKEAIDASLSAIDFENDSLPYNDESVDTVVCANVLEHVFNHRHLIVEMHRVLKSTGTLVGFVPFLIQYHPDPHDYFRYTKEALVRLFTDAGLVDVRVETIGGGPFAVNFNNIMLSMPRQIAALFFFIYWPLDCVFLKLRPAARGRYPLGFIFSAKK
ncbi:MAG TPA: methyltransferase domain-containing protein [Candidatus Paceibacterota bacterium]|nr:methyltransferase domain-containing protein [Candidatus Paceibacterota bacterium]